MSAHVHEWRLQELSLDFIDVSTHDEYGVIEGKISTSWRCCKCPATLREPDVRQVPDEVFSLSQHQLRGCEVDGIRYIHLNDLLLYLDAARNGFQEHEEVSAKTVFNALIDVLSSVEPDTIVGNWVIVSVD